MRILVINPNMTQDITARVVKAAQSFLPMGTELVGVTGRFGSPYITSRPSFAVGVHAALDALAGHCSTPLDAVMLACFGDPALAALREISAVPVIGMAEASCHLASRSAGRFSIVTGGAAWVPMLEEFVASIGLTARLASIKATAMTGGEIARDPDRALDALAGEISACAGDGAERVILGGAGLAGIAGTLASRVGVPLIDCIEAMARITIEAISVDQLAGRKARTSPSAAAFRASFM